MAVSVKIPTPLRRLTDQQSTVSADGGDVIGDDRLVGRIVSWVSRRGCATNRVISVTSSTFTSTARTFDILTEPTQGCQTGMK